ncbi:MAG: helix-turn-helix domain-containing protein [Spirochaetes bacterium]|nr:helix-turn-helix domain-containing protein [Spirochaetota bacterium]
MRIIRIFLGTMTIALLWAVPLQSAAIRLDDLIEKLPVGLNMDILRDDAGTLTIQDVSGENYKDKWVPSHNIIPGFGFTESVFWTRFSIANETYRDIPFFLEHGYPLIDDLKIFIPQRNGTFKTIETGDMRKFSERPYNTRTFVFPLTGEARSSKTYYLRQKSTGSMSLPLTVWSPDGFKSWSRFEDRLLMFYYGMILIMVFNYLCIYFLIRHISFLYFALFISSMLLFIMSQIGVTFQFFMPNNPKFAEICPPLFLCLANLFGNRFIPVFLQLKKNVPIFKTIMDIEVIVLLVATVSCVTIPFYPTYRYLMPLSAILTMVSIITAFVVGIYLVYLRLRSAYLFTFVMIGFMFGAIVYAFKSFGVLPGSFIATWSIVIGTTSILLFLSVAMVDRINLMRKGLKKASENLEKEVKERSIELLLSQITSKIMEEEECRERPVTADSDKKYTQSLQNLLNTQRDVSIRKLSHDISIVSNVNELMEETIMTVMDITSAQKAYIFMIDDESDLQLLSFTDLHENNCDGYSQDIVDQVFSSGKYVITPFDKAGLDPDAEMVFGSGPDCTSLCIPIMSDGRNIGICYIERDYNSGPFTEKDARLLMAFSDNVVSVIENAAAFSKKLSPDEQKKNYSLTKQTKDKILLAIEYIKENYTSDISREGLAASLDISPNHLGKFFRIYTGLKINEYINSLRINDAAKRLRENRDENIINIAFLVGFESLSTFNRAFLKVMGTTPTEYKDQF